MIYLLPEELHRQVVDALDSKSFHAERGHKDAASAFVTYDGAAADLNALARYVTRLETALASLRSLPIPQGTEAVRATLQDALNAPGCERLRDFYAVGPVQRAAVEAFVDAIRSPAASGSGAKALVQLFRENAIPMSDRNSLLCSIIEEAIAVRAEEGEPVAEVGANGDTFRITRYLPPGTKLFTRPSIEPPAAVQGADTRMPFNPNAKCSPTLTQCPRCNNPHNACDTSLAALTAPTSPQAAPPSVTEASLREIDLALAAMADLKPMVEYGEPGTFDTVQARRKTALLRAERSLLFLRRELSPSTPTDEGKHG